MMLLIVLTLLVALLSSWWSIVLCPEEDQTTGFWCVCFTLSLQIVSGIVFRDAWEKEPIIFLMAVSFLQTFNFMSVRFSRAVREGYPSFRKLKPVIPAALFSGIFTLTMWSFAAAMVNGTH
ncbi:hypothetical protein FEI17_27140 (plasmid) [Kosakonia radicincitans]|uniref:hypothetical protein n=1 Tax=Kosakonia radicincitans TaxID=283686 RepID=UPI0011EDB03A|nr:hypothetical protein [Kosakonia radicincitans]QEM94309.1 hypothetical protein FEI17_27140 [Kosakonia radicincitans]